ncbi:MAG: type II secretion system F family protein [Heliobacteriaceae bacterium]|nr:type II secretion system F family protein [Heliobacteriaceae bacterium]MDD4588310.1 type II secretion system F family protein [Heliobacteriaceae bacterium]
MEFVVAGFSFITVFLLVYGVYELALRQRIAVLKRLEGIQRHTQAVATEELNQPFFDRLIRPLLQKFSGKVANMMPKEKKATLDKRLTAAGNPANLSPEQFRTLQYFGAGLGLGLGILFVGVSGVNPGWGFLLEVAFLFIGFLLPDSVLNSLIKGRQRSIQNNLPDVLDLLTVSVEAGLGFDAAVAKVVEKSSGPVAVEFGRVMGEINVGKPRREALRDMAIRNGIDDLTAFVGAIVQADTLGVSIGNVLRIQAQQMRQARRQRAEERAMKAPIKMLLPMIIFIFPAIFVVLLGPAILKLMAEVSK